MISSFLSDPTAALISLLLSLPGVVLAITLHESAHGWMALKLGDDTALRQGRISLNPLHHVDIYGLLMLILLRFGWAKPVSVDPRKFKNPRTGMCLTALAGPVSNLLLAFILLACAMGMSIAYGNNYLRFGDTTFSTVLEVIMRIFQYAAITNLGLGIFNFIPCPPLDGWKVLGVMLPPKTYFGLMRFERYGMFVLLALMLTGVISTPMNIAINGVYGFYYDVLSGIFGLLM